MDDNALFLRVLGAVLERGEPAFRTHGVATGSAAVAWLDDESAHARADFIVLDFHLPDTDAPQVLHRLRRPGGRAGHIPVLVLTQAYWVEDEIAARAAGATEFLAKPSSLAELRRVIVDFWRASAARPQITSMYRYAYAHRLTKSYDR